jgi:hypothetical protein
MPRSIKQRRRIAEVKDPDAIGSTEASQGEPASLWPTEEQISLLMATMGHKGGKIGGKRRLETMTPAARRKIAKKAANARWAKSKRPL